MVHPEQAHNQRLEELVQALVVEILQHHGLYSTTPAATIVTGADFTRAWCDVYREHTYLVQMISSVLLGAEKKMIRQSHVVGGPGDSAERIRKGLHMPPDDAKDLV